MIKLIASDLDGTLIRVEENKLNPELFDIILKLKEKGIRFAAASGRPLASILDLFDPVKNDIFYITENGSLTICDGKTVGLGSIDRELALRIFQAAREQGSCEFFVSCNGKCYTESTNSQFLNYMHNVVHFNMEKVSSLDDISDPFIKFAIYDPNGTEEILPYFRERFGNEIEIVTSGNEWIDFLAPDANKGTGLEQVCKYMGISREECIAFGDQYNDIAMLEYAGSSYAMNTCAPGVEKHADYQTDSVESVLKTLL